MPTDGQAPSVIVLAQGDFVSDLLPWLLVAVLILAGIGLIAYLILRNRNAAQTSDVFGQPDAFPPGPFPPQGAGTFGLAPPGQQPPGQPPTGPPPTGQSPGGFGQALSQPSPGVASPPPSGLQGYQQPSVQGQPAQGGPPQAPGYPPHLPPDFESGPPQQPAPPPADPSPLDQGPGPSAAAEPASPEPANPIDDGATRTFRPEDLLPPTEDPHRRRPPSE